MVNSIFWVLRTGAPWQALPRQQSFAPPSTAHEWLGKMQKEGFLDQFLKELLEIADCLGFIDAERLSADGFFSGGRGGGEQVDYGYKGKGVTTHLLVEKSGRPLAVTSTPASGDERQQVGPLLNKIHVLIGKIWKKGKIPILEADKGYDALDVRKKTLSHKVFSLIAHRKRTKGYRQQGLCYLEKQRWVIERTISWLKTCFSPTFGKMGKKEKILGSIPAICAFKLLVKRLGRWIFKKCI